MNVATGRVGASFLLREQIARGQSVLLLPEFGDGTSIPHASNQARE